MDNKGQTLVLFVILLPLVFLAIYFVGNYLYLSIEKNDQEKIAKDLCSYYKKEKDLVKTEELATARDKDQIVSIIEKDNTIEITLEKIHKSIINQKNKIKTVITCE